MKGKYFNGSAWVECDHSVCAECHDGSATNCWVPCKTNCKTCDVEADCVSCN